MKTSESIVNLAKALVEAQKNMGNAVKDSKNPFFKSSYATLNAVREACIPSLNTNGISVLQPMTTNENGKNFIETVLMHSSGEFISSSTEVIVPDAKRNDAQAHGSAQSYARRYGLQSLLCIGAEDDDGESAVRSKSAPVAQQQTEVPAPRPPNTSGFKRPPTKKDEGDLI